MKAKDKNILLIAYSYPPIYDPQAIRWYWFSKLLAEQGYKIDVISIKLPYPNGIEFHPNVSVKRIFPGIVEFLAFSSKYKMGLGLNNTDRTKREKFSFIVLKKGYWLIRNFFNSTLIGDLRTEWLPFCVTYLKKVDLSKYNVLITSQEPFVGGLIGLYIKRKMPDLFWIADIGDPVDTPYSFSLKKPLDKYFEGKIVKKANRIIVTNENVRYLFSMKYKISKQKIIVIRQGFDINRFSSNNSNKQRNDKFVLFFSGTFYKGFREPYALIDAIYELKDLNIELIIAGRNEHFWKHFKKLGKRVKLLGFVPHQKILYLQDRSDVLINISNKQVYQIPGKIFEYIGARKPILNIVYNLKKDESVNIIERHKIGLNCLNEKEPIKQAIKELYKLWKNNVIYSVFRFDDKVLAEYSWQAGAEKLDKIIKSSYE